MKKISSASSACGVLAVVLLLGACAGYGPSGIVAGQSEGDVARSMGAPTGRYALAGGGARLEYARGPYGKETYMVDLDAAGRVTGWQQVLTEANFLRVVPGLPRQELLLLLGRPGEVYGVPWQNAQVWNWRYPTNDCLWFQVTVAADGRVKDAGHGIDRRCDGPPDRP
jgi:hypothetical protein